MPLPRRSKREVPHVEGVLGRDAVAETVDAIARVQLPSGNIPWLRDGHTDPWNHVEAAMALDVGGRHADAERAYEWLRNRQRPDGAWHNYYVGDAVSVERLDTNCVCYVANGVLHHYLATGDDAFVEEFWPVVERAMDFALDHQAPTGEIAWDADPTRREWRGALLTGSSSIHSSLRCAIVLAEHLGRERPDWELSLGSLAHAIAHRPGVFLDKDLWAMDWYYPILGGVLRGEAAARRLSRGWGAFVVPGRGVRCVSHRPWITAAETCELVLALDAIGNRAHAIELFEGVQFLRADGGGYWTGMNFENESFHLDGQHYPEEQPTWNSAAVVHAANALGGTSLTAGFFRGEGLPIGLDADAVLAEEFSARRWR